MPTSNIQNSLICEDVHPIRGGAEVGASVRGSNPSDDQDALLIVIRALVRQIAVLLAPRDRERGTSLEPGLGVALKLDRLSHLHDLDLGLRNGNLNGSGVLRRSIRRSGRRQVSLVCVFGQGGSNEDHVQIRESSEEVIFGGITGNTSLNSDPTLFRESHLHFLYEENPCFPRFQDDPGLEASPYICIFPPGFQRASRDPEILDQSIAPEINFQDPTLPNAFKGAVDRRSLKLKPKPKSYNVAFPSGSRLLPRLY
eukprot:maker-scaffold48_size466083-snap-gene-0.5 protein:Tk05963 transcript:maker-scaffold48_size466083-snap-gene-0.5-mRNA-1 annotation:"family transcriptional regulator"